MAQLQRALTTLNHALRLDPGNAPSLASRGAAYAPLGQFQPAARDLDEAILLDPEHAKSHNNRAYIALNLGKIQQAIQHLNTAISLDPLAGPAYTNRGFAYHRSGRDQQAVQDLDQAVGLITEDITAYRRWGLAYDGWEQYRRPREDFDEAILIVPWIGGVYAVRGVANALLGRDSASFRDIDLAAQRGLDRRLVERAIRLERSKAVLRGGEFLGRVADAVDAGHENHRHFGDLGKSLGVVAGAAGQPL